MMFRAVEKVEKNSTASDFFTRATVPTPFSTATAFISSDVAGITSMCWAGSKRNTLLRAQAKTLSPVIATILYTGSPAVPLKAFTVGCGAVGLSMRRTPSRQLPAQRRPWLSKVRQ